MKRNDIVMNEYLTNFLKFDLGHMDVSKYNKKILDINYYNDLNLDLYFPDSEGPYPVVISVYGGGFVSGFKQSKFIDPMIKPINHGYAVVIPDYTKALDAPYPQPILDLKQCVKWVYDNKDKYNFDLSNISIWGESAGGYLVLATGLMDNSLFNIDEKYKVHNIISLYPVVDIETINEDSKKVGIKVSDDPNEDIFSIFIGKAINDEDKRKESNPINHLRNNSPRILLQQGDKDVLVPYLQADRLYKAALDKETYIEYELVKDKVHTDPYFFTDDNVERIIKFIEG